MTWLWTFYESKWWSISWVTAGWAMHLWCLSMVCIHCLRQRREATSAILWMFVSWSFPVIGPVLYLMFGVDRLPDKGIRKYIADHQLIEERQARAGTSLPMAYWHHVVEAMAGPPEDELARTSNQNMGRILVDHPLIGGNRLKPLVTGDEAYPAMLAAIEAATDHIHLQSFIIDPDTIGKQFMDALAERARNGVTVRVLYDRFGSTTAVFRRFFHRYRNIPNLSIVGWTQVNLLRRQFQVNLRNHRKLLIVDGMRAFCGGINLQAANASRDGASPIRDYHVHIAGPFVHELQFSFMQDWFFMTRAHPEGLLCERYFPQQKPLGRAMLRLVNSGPTLDMQTITEVFFMAVTQARRQVLIVTPYFAPSQDIIRALRSAALRGVDVRLIVPLKNNHIYAGLAGRAHYGDLLAAGVHVFERPPPFIHAKALIVDDAMAIVGTANWDVRSLRLNYETSVAVYDDRFVNELKRIVIEDEAKSREVDLTAWRMRPIHRRMAENLCALMTPVL